MGLYLLTDMDIYELIFIIGVLALYTGFTVFTARKYLMMRFKQVFLGKQGLLIADMQGSGQWGTGELKNGWIRQPFGDYEAVNAAVRGEADFMIIFKPFSFMVSLPWLTAVTFLESIGLHSLQDALDKYDKDWFMTHKAEFEATIAAEKDKKTEDDQATRIALKSIQWSGREALMRLEWVTPFTLATNIVYNNWALRPADAQQNKNVMDRALNIADKKYVEQLKTAKMGFSSEKAMQWALVVIVLFIGAAIAYYILTGGHIGASVPNVVNIGNVTT